MVSTGQKTVLLMMAMKQFKGPRRVNMQKVTSGQDPSDHTVYVTPECPFYGTSLLLLSRQDGLSPLFDDTWKIFSKENSDCLQIWA